MKALTALACLLLASGGAGCKGPRAARDDPARGDAGREPAATDRGQRSLLQSLKTRSVEVRGLPPGTDALAVAAIAELLRQYDDSNGADAYLDDAAFELGLALQGAGYPGAEVEYREGFADGEERATLEVDAGPRVVIDGVEIVGSETSPLRRREVEAALGLPEPNLFGKRGDWVYDRGRVERAPSRLEKALAAEGYVDAVVTIADLDLAAVTGPVVLRVEVEPGRRHRLTAIELELPEGSSPEAAAAAQQVVEAVLGPVAARPKPFMPRVAKDLYGALVEALVRLGHVDATIRIEQEIDSERARVRLVARVDPGPAVHVGQVLFEGAGRTRRSFLAERVKLDEGDLLDGASLRNDVRRLYRTGLFSEVRTRMAGDGETRDLVFELLERNSREVYVEPGYGSYELLRLKAGYRERNLFGTGLGWRTEGTAAIRALRATSTLTNPWLFGRDLIGELRVEYDLREEPSFVRVQRGAGAYVTKEWTPRHSSSFGYQFRRSEVQDVTVEAGFQDDPDVVDLSTLRFTQRRDGRDDAFLPRDGTFAEGTLEYGSDALGSELSFVRTMLSLSTHHALGSRTVLAAGVRTGLIVPIEGDDSIPLQERFFNGGANSVRSFGESELGPRDANGEPVGGETFTTFNLELRQALSRSLQVALFADAGNVTIEHADYFEFADLRYGVGLGVRYVLPIGPLRLDFGLNPDPEPDEDDWALHFSIGLAF